MSHPIIKSLYPKDVTEINNHINLSNDFYVGEEYLRQTKLGTIFTTISDIQEKLKNTLGTKVAISSKGDGAGRIEIEFYTHEDLDRLVDIFSGRR